MAVHVKTLAIKIQVMYLKLTVLHKDVYITFKSGGQNTALTPYSVYASPANMV